MGPRRHPGLSVDHPAPGAPSGLALGGVVGPVAFVTAWAWCGWVTDGYSPVSGAISDLAARGSPTRAIMTAGFVVFGVAVPLYGLALRQAGTGWAGLAAVVCGLATLGVAAVPLGRGHDGLHGAFAGLGYVALTLVAVFMVGPLRRMGRRRWANAGTVAAVVAGSCLVATAWGPAHGLFQRLGLTVGDAWLVAGAVVVVRRGSFGPPPGEPA